MNALLIECLIFVVFIVLQDVNGLQKRCFQCRSRGESGSCRDPFPFNVTQADDELGLYVVPCASGWCGKIMEGQNSFKDDDYGAATQRLCLQSGPTDNQERCADILWKHRRVNMCFCNGDMCNSSPSLKSLPILVAATSICFFFWRIPIL